jgi:hypothetical protein
MAKTDKKSAKKRLFSELEDVLGQLGLLDDGSDRDYSKTIKLFEGYLNELMDVREEKNKKDAESDEMEEGKGFLSALSKQKGQLTEMTAPGYEGDEDDRLLKRRRAAMEEQS